MVSSPEDEPFSFAYPFADTLLIAFWVEPRHLVIRILLLWKLTINENWRIDREANETRGISIITRKNIITPKDESKEERERERQWFLEDDLTSLGHV